MSKSSLNGFSTGEHLSQISEAEILDLANKPKLDHWTVRDFYTLREEFAYVALLVQKADKKSKRLKFDIGNHLHNCMSPYRHVHDLYWSSVSRLPSSPCNGVGVNGGAGSNANARALPHDALKHVFIVIRAGAAEFQNSASCRDVCV